jgi:hypothetical protein
LAFEPDALLATLLKAVNALAEAEKMDAENDQQVSRSDDTQYGAFYYPWIWISGRELGARDNRPMADAPELRLVPEFRYRVTTTTPLGPTAGSPLGRTQYWQVSAAELEGPRIRARLAAPGSDWMRMTPDGLWRPNVQAPFLTESNDLILMSYTGLVEQTNAFVAAAEQDRETTFADQYMRLVLTFDTGASEFLWLTRNIFIAAGRLLGTGRIEYAVYRLS